MTVSRAAIAPLLALAAAGCGDLFGPSAAERGRRLQLLAATPATDTVGRLGFEFAAQFGDTANRVASAVLYVDSGTATERTYVLKREYPGYPSPRVQAPAFADRPGRHTFTLVATSSRGDTAAVTIARHFVVADVPYVAAPLPDLGRGAGVAGVSATGLLSGWVVDEQGVRQPAVWRGTTLVRVPAPDARGATALQTNAAGDVLLFVPDTGPQRSFVRRADGALLPLGPMRPPAGSHAETQGSVSCCITPAALNERRQALGWGTWGWRAYASILYDVAAGARIDSTYEHRYLLNGAGQIAGAGYSSAGFGYDSEWPMAWGFTLPPVPTGPTLPGCDAVGRWHRSTASALDDDGNMLLRTCGTLGFASRAGSVWLDRWLGPVTSERLSSNGGWVVARQPTTGDVYRWNATRRTTERVVVEGGAWRVDSLTGITSTGAIAGFATQLATGRGAPVLLTPAN